VNSGINWTKIDNWDSQNVILSFIQSGSYFLASVSDKGIYRSTNGDNWKVINPDFMPENYRRIVVGIAPSDENQIYFFGETPGSGKDGLNAYGEVIWHSFWKYTYLSGDGSGAGGKSGK